MSFTKLKVCNT